MQVSYVAENTEYFFMIRYFKIEMRNSIRDCSVKYELMHQLNAQTRSANWQSRRIENRKYISSIYSIYTQFKVRNQSR